MTESPYFRFAIWILLCFLIILVGSHISFVFQPLVIIVKTVFFPILLSGVLYYLMMPVVDKLTAHKVSKTIAILLLYLAFILLMAIVVMYVAPILQRQVTSLIENAPALFNGVRMRVLELQEHPVWGSLIAVDTLSVEELAHKFSQYINQVFYAIVNNVTSFVGTLTGVFTTLLMIPFILFYMLKSGHELPGAITRFLPEQHRQEGKKILGELDLTLSSFIQGQIIVSVSVGVLCYIGFLIIGIDYAMILALAAMVTNVIPFIGPFIGTIPALIVGMLDSPLMVIKVLIVILVVQQMESLFISPRVMGDKLSIHPVTIVLLILVAGNLAGFLGLILAIPAYAVAKVVAAHMYKLIRLRLNGGKS